MSRRHPFRSLVSWSLPCALLVILSTSVGASGPYLGHVFCPVNKRCQEKPPHWHIKRTCPAKPVCDPCTLEHHGYYHTCWRPSSIPADWSHCPVPPPAVVFGTVPALPPAVPPPALLTPAAPPQALPMPNAPAPEVKPTKPAPVRSSVPVTPPPVDSPLPSKPTLNVTPPPGLTPPPANRPAAYLPPPR